MNAFSKMAKWLADRGAAAGPKPGGASPERALRNLPQWPLSEYFDSKANRYIGPSLSQIMRYEGFYSTDSLTDAVSNALASKWNFESEKFKSLSEVEKYVLAFSHVQKEAFCNGLEGLLGFCAELTPYFVPALKAIGADEVAEIVGDAIALLGDIDLNDPVAVRAARFGPAPDNNDDEDQWVDFDEVDDRLNAWMNHPHAEFDDRAWQYIKENAADIHFQVGQSMT
jgi:hypothetical protein